MVDHGTLFDRAPVHRPLANVAAFLQDAYRRGTARERNGEDAREVERFEPVSRQNSYGGGGDPSPPEGFSEPVTDLSRTTLDVAPQLEPDPAGGLAMHFYCEVRLRVLKLNEGDPLFGIRVGVGVGEEIPQAAPDLVVVGVTNQRMLIAHPPRSKHAATAVEPHALVLSGAVMGFHRFMVTDGSFPLQGAVGSRGQVAPRTFLLLTAPNVIVLGSYTYRTVAGLPIRHFWTETHARPPTRIRRRAFAQPFTLKVIVLSYDRNDKSAGARRLWSFRSLLSSHLSLPAIQTVSSSIAGSIILSMLARYCIRENGIPFLQGRAHAR